MLRTINLQKLQKSVLIGWTMVILAGCNQMNVSATAETSTQLPPTIIEETPTMNDSPIPTPLDAGLEIFVTQAKDDLSKRLVIDPQQIEVLEASSVTWPDGSLGCPKPGMAYTQVQVEGIRVRLSVNGKVYDYHGGGGRSLFLCE